MHRLKRIDARRQAVASLVLLTTYLACLWIGTYREPVPVTSPPCCAASSALTFTPRWTLPVALVVGIGGLAVAVAIYVPRRTRG
jgi:hypothetical protein